MSKPIPAINRYKADLREFTFLLFEQFGIDELLGQAPFDAWGADECNATLAGAYRWVREVTGPLNAIGDHEGCQHRGRPRHHSHGLQGGVEEPVRGRLEAALGRPRVRRRGGSPRSLQVFVEEMITRLEHRLLDVRGALASAPPRSSSRSARRSRRSSTTRACSTASGAARCASPSRRPAATSAARRPRRPRTATAATPSAAPRSSSPAGDHDLAENIVHLVLARVDGAPAGTKGLTLFIVPKFRTDADGKLGGSNDVSVANIEHKMGINGVGHVRPELRRRGHLPRLARRRRREAQPGHAADVQADEQRAHRRRHPGPRRRVDRVPERARVREGPQAGREHGALEGPDGAARAHHRARRRAPHAARHEVAGRGHPRAHREARAPPRLRSRCSAARTRRRPRTTRARSTCSCRS